MFFTSTKTYRWISNRNNSIIKETTAKGFEPSRAEPIGFRVRLLNHSDTLPVDIPFFILPRYFIVILTKDAVTKTTPVGFEPTRAEPTGLAGRRLNHSAKVSC